MATVQENIVFVHEVSEQLCNLYLSVFERNYFLIETIHLKIWSYVTCNALQVYSNKQALPQNVCIKKTSILCAPYM